MDCLVGRIEPTSNGVQSDLMMATKTIVFFFLLLSVITTESKFSQKHGVFPKSTLVNSEHAALNDAGGPSCVSCDKVMSVFLELKERVDSIDNLIEQQLADLVAENASCKAKTCSHLKNLDPSAKNGSYIIDPDGEGGLEPFTVYCDMSDKNGVGVTVISHDSESRTHVQGYEDPGSYSRDIHYTGASLSQLASLASVSPHCEQFIKYECFHAALFQGGTAWWVSRDSSKMTYWGGASPDSGKCACGMNNSCADPSRVCNCDKNDNVWREDSGLLTGKTHLPVAQLRFGDTGYGGEQGYHTLGKLKCYGIE
ncbi:hypothetical protein ACROYT_G021009 [Oculina patagonica]